MSSINPTPPIVLEHVVIPEDSSLLVRYDQEATIEVLEYHQHQELEFQFTQSGFGNRLIGDVLEPFDNHGVLIIPPLIPHTWYYQNPAADPDYRIQEYNIQFDLEVIISRMSAFPEFAESVRFLREMKYPVEILGEDAVTIREKIKAMLHQDGVTRLLTFFQIIRLCSTTPDIRLLRLENTVFDNHQKQTRIRELYAYMDAHLSEEIELDEMASMMNMSKTSFCNFFKRATGKTFTFALNEMRINRAAMLLSSDKNRSIAEIAYSVGYNSSSRFCSVFRKMRGQSPKSYCDHLKQTNSQKRDQ